MPDPQQILSDPNFYALPDAARVEVLKKADPRFAGLPAEAQHGVVVQGEVRHAAKQAGVDPDFAASIAHAENGYKREGTSSAGAQGTMQVMPDTAKQVLGSGAKLPVGVDQNIAIGTTYLGQMLQRYGGDKALAAAAYNAGPGRVDAAIKAAGSRDYAAIAPHLPAETQAYVPKVTHIDIYGGQGTPSPPEGGPGGPGLATEPFPGTPEGTAPPEGPEAGSGALDAMASGLARGARAAIFDGLVYPAHELDRLGYSFGIPGFTPPADHVHALENSPLGHLVGQPNLDLLNQDTPAGFWGRFGAAAGTMEPLYLPTFGSYVAARTFGADEAFARTIEAGVGGLALIHEGSKIVANLMAPRAIARAAARQGVATGIAKEAHAKAAAEAEGAGLTQVIRTQRAETAASVEQGKAAMIALTTRREAPADLTEIGERLLQPGKQGILSGSARRLQQRVSKAYDAWKAAGQKYKLFLGGGALREGLSDTVQQIENLSRTEGATPAERAVAQQISDVLTPTIGHRAVTEAERQAIEMGAIQPRAPMQTPDVPIEKLIDLKSTVGRVGLSPRDYPVFRSSPGRLLFGKLGAELDEVLRTLSVGNPEVEAASQEARQLAQQQFRLRQTVRRLLKAETPEAAASMLFARGAPTRLWRIFQEARPSEMRAMQLAYLNDVFKTSTDAFGNPDFEAAWKAWGQVNSRARRLLAPIGFPEAKIALSGMIRDRKLNINHPALVEAENRMSTLLNLLKKEQAAAEDVTKAATHAEQHVIEFQRSGGQSAGGFTRMMAKHAALGLGISAILGGQGLTPKSALEAAAWVHWMLIYPKYAAAAIKTPLNTEHGMLMARAIAGLLNGYYGLPGNRPAGTAPVAGQAPQGSQPAQVAQQP